MEFRGCGDNSCQFVKPKGMATNGGCRCYANPTLARHAIRMLQMKISEHVDVLGGLLPLVNGHIGLCATGYAHNMKESACDCEVPKLKARANELLK